MVRVVINGIEYKGVCTNISNSTIVVDGNKINISNCKEKEIIVEGDVKGSIDCVNLTVNGNVTGDINGTNITVKGKVDGDIDGVNVSCRR